MAFNIKDFPDFFFKKNIYVEELRWPQISHSQVESVENLLIYEETWSLFYSLDIEMFT